jgi:hypothetical protein
MNRAERENIPNSFPSPSHGGHSHPAPHASQHNAPSLTPSSTVVTRMKKSTVSFSATFVGLSGYPDEMGSFTTSPLVELDDQLWSVRLYPGGIDEDSRGFLSCYVTYESRGRIRASYKISLVNQMGWKNHVHNSEGVKTFINQSEDPEDCQNVWGDDRFISQSVLRNPSNGHCVDDTIVVRVDLVIYGDMEQSVSKSYHFNLGGISLFPEKAALHSPGQRTILQDLSSMLFDQSTADVYFHIMQHKPTKSDTSATTLLTISTSLKDELSTPIADVSEEEEELIEVIPAHKFILCLRSPVFRAMLTGSTHAANAAGGSHESAEHTYAESASGKIVIHDFSAKAIRAMLEYMYTDCLGISTAAANSSGPGSQKGLMKIPSTEQPPPAPPVNSPSVSTNHPTHSQSSSAHAPPHDYEDEILHTYGEELLAIACKYNLIGLETMCIAFLSSHLTASTVGHVLSLADMLGAEELKDRAMQYIKQNASRVVATEGFFENLSFGLCQEIVKKLAGV